MSGETGAAGLAGTFAMKEKFNEDATVLVLVTEGVTDKANFERIVKNN